MEFAASQGPGGGHAQDDPAPAEGRRVGFGAFLLPEVLAEIVYVLSGVYEVPRDELAEKLLGFLDEVQCDQPAVLRRALSTYGAKKVDLVDCLLLAYHVETGDTVVTFDKDLRKLLDAAI